MIAVDLELKLSCHWKVGKGEGIILTTTSQPYNELTLGENNTTELNVLTFNLYTTHLTKVINQQSIIQSAQWMHSKLIKIIHNVHGDMMLQPLPVKIRGIWTHRNSTSRMRGRGRGRCLLFQSVSVPTALSLTDHQVGGPNLWSSLSWSAKSFWTFFLM